MKNKITKTTIGTFFSLLILIVGAQFLVLGQNSEKRERTIEGTWQTVITQRNCQTGQAIRTFQGILTFSTGGTMVGDSTVASPALKTASYGVWQREMGWQEYSFAFMFFRFNPDGSLAGSQKVRQNLTLGASGNDFTTTGTVEVIDPNGNTVANGCTTSTGTRFE